MSMQASAQQLLFTSLDTMIRRYTEMVCMGAEPDAARWIAAELTAGAFVRMQAGLGNAGLLSFDLHLVRPSGDAIELATWSPPPEL